MVSSFFFTVSESNALGACGVLPFLFVLAGCIWWFASGGSWDCFDVVSFFFRANV